ncbi:hypothetical protein [Streptomyces regalis]|uniref:Uncharacterized protein n=1 Tax=Streptomyces regalis TaxID=68262 RepID=A0A117MJX4_9ACTN|nr:hypothetical protein [Streptomyces regalis]KUL21309.1 hypothetical protein ADL12_45065 [Streptomyces regalis]
MLTAVGRAEQGVGELVVGAGGGGVVAGIARTLGSRRAGDLSEGAVEGLVGEQLAARGSMGSSCLGGRGDPGAAGEGEPELVCNLRDRGDTAPDRAGDLVA